MILASPTWLAYVFAALMVVVAVFCVARMVIARPLGRLDQYDVDTCHALMAAAMIGMLVPRWNKIPSDIWQVVFAAFLVWFVVCAIRAYRHRGGAGDRGAPREHTPHHILHAFMAFAMLDMYWIGMPVSSHGASGVAMSGGPHTSGNPLLTLLIVVVLLGLTLWEIDSAFLRSSAQGTLAASGVGALATIDGHAPRARDHVLLTPRLEVASYAAMCITVAFSLVLML